MPSPAAVHLTARTTSALSVAVDGSTARTSLHFTPKPGFLYERVPVQLAVRTWTSRGIWELQSPGPVPHWRFHPARSVELLHQGTRDCAFRVLQPGPIILTTADNPPLLIHTLPPELFRSPPAAVRADSVGIKPSTDPRECSDRLNHAIARISQRGGGVIALGPGVYPVTTIRMQSRVLLHLHEEAILRGPEDPTLYPLRSLDDLFLDLPPSLIPGSRRCLIEFDHVHHSGLIGPGRIDGCGSELRRSHLSDRPLVNHVFAVESARLRFEGVTLLDSEFWSTHLVLCRDVDIRRVTVLNEIPPPAWAAHLGPHAARWTWNNADGINPDSSQGIRMEHCLFHTGDDCVPIKNTGTFRNRLRDVSDVSCRRSVMMTPVTAMKLGTESRGDLIENIVFEDIDVVHAGRPIGVELKDGAKARNIVFRDIRVHECNRPFDFVILRRDDQKDQTRFSSLENVHVDGLVVDRHATEGAWFHCRIQGLDADHGISGVRLDRVRISGAELEETADPLLRINAHTRDIEVG